MSNKKVTVLERFIELLLRQPQNVIFFYDGLGYNWELFQTDADETETLQQEHTDMTK